MPSSILVIGGCRSGKSDHAQVLAETTGTRRLYLATCVPHDDEMRERVQQHRDKRQPPWETLEIPVDVSGSIFSNKQKYDVILVDCLTLWVSNLLLSSPGNAEMDRALGSLEEAIGAPGCPLIFVTNEVGTGVVPENRLARRFRDDAGRVNQAVAAAANTVIWMVAGIPVTIKPADGRLP